ncbi:MAG: hypothetical protein CME06_16165 [Gemmatimonadetes bacterium]|nr:hypothetical protein [Gemmatimonadota bacterium]
MPKQRTSFGVVAGVASIAILAGCESTSITDPDFNAIQGTGGDLIAAPYVDQESADAPVLGYNGDDGPWADPEEPALGYEGDGFWADPQVPVIGYEEDDSWAKPEDPVLGYDGDDPWANPDVPIEVVNPSFSYPFEFQMVNPVGDDAWGNLGIDFESRDLRLVVGELKAEPTISYEIQVHFLSDHTFSEAGWFSFSDEGQMVMGHWELPPMGSEPDDNYPDRIIVVEHDENGPGFTGEEVLVATIPFNRGHEGQDDRSVD